MEDEFVYRDGKKYYKGGIVNLSKEEWEENSKKIKERPSWWLIEGELIHCCSWEISMYEEMLRNKSWLNEPWYAELKKVLKELEEQRDASLLDKIEASFKKFREEN